VKQGGKAVLKIHSALVDMTENLNDAQACSKAESLADAVQKFCFLVSVVFWHDILHLVDKISKTLQKEDADLNGRVGWFNKVAETISPV